MKKFYIIILTLLGLVLSNPLYLQHNIYVSFNQTLNDDTKYYVFYTNAQYETFDNRARVKYEAKKTQKHVKIKINQPKLTKFRLDIEAKPGTIILSDFKINNKKLDSNKFKTSANTQLSVIDNKFLKITSTKNVYKLQYVEDVNVKNKIPSVSYQTFLILLCLWLMLSYFFVSFVYKRKNKIDAIFVVIFGILLFIPMLHISDAETSKTEKRRFATKPNLFIDGKINNRYGNQFDDFFSDRFFCRDTFLHLYKDVKYFVAPTAGSERVLIGKEGWLFSKEYDADKMYQNLNLFTPEELDKIGHNLEIFEHQAKKIGIKRIYFVIENDKESIYPEYYPNYIKKMNNESRLDQLLTYLHKNYPNLTVLNFKQELLKTKETETIFFKTGTHMNNIGAYTVSNLLLKSMQKDFNKIKPLSLDDFNIQESDKFSQEGLDLDIYNQLNPAFYSHKNIKNKVMTLKQNTSEKIEEHKQEHITGRVFINKKAPNNIKIFALGDSFLKRYIVNLSQRIKKINHVLIERGKPLTILPEDLHDLYNDVPDIMIVQSTERFLQRFLTLEFPAKPKKD